VVGCFGRISKKTGGKPVSWAVNAHISRQRSAVF
jgi:hypothetical protein